MSADDPGTGQNAHDPATGQNADDPGTGQNADDPATGQNADDPATGQNADDPATGQNAHDPATGQNADVGPKEYEKQELQKLLLQRARKALDDGDLKKFDSLAERLLDTQPRAREDRMDRWRLYATGIMLAALVYIIIEIVRNNETSGNLFQFVSLTSGLAGIGLGWLFGAGTTRR
jgi:hypothetical protein